jgi:hypothetical protein
MKLAVQHNSSLTTVVLSANCATGVARPRPRQATSQTRKATQEVIMCVSLQVECIV